MMPIRTGKLVLIAGAVMLVDTLWGGFASLWFDLGRINEVVLAISFVLGFPAYLLDVWLDRRVAVAMICLFFFRWIALCFAGPTPVLSNPLRANLLIILGFALLQASRVRRRGQFGDPSPSI